MDLPEFLLARIDEDKTAAEEWQRDDLDADGAWFGATRMLAECEAKRRIVEHYQDWYAAYRADRIGFDRMDQVIALRWALEQVGLLWVDHPDYQEEWRP